MRSILVLFLSALLASAALAQKPDAGFDPKRDATKDIAGAIKIATKQNKRILLDVGGNW